MCSVVEQAGGAEDPQVYGCLYKCMDVCLPFCCLFLAKDKISCKDLKLKSKNNCKQLAGSLLGSDCHGSRRALAISTSLLPESGAFLGVQTSKAWRNCAASCCPSVLASCMFLRLSEQLDFLTKEGGSS